MFYRFYPILDNNVECFISRDLDSNISFREEKMVEEWLNTNSNLHLIHEVYPGHRHIIMGGMFGFKKNIDKNSSTDFDNKILLNDYDEFYYEPWNETCYVKWEKDYLRFIGKNDINKSWCLNIEYSQDFLNGKSIKILWHNKIEKIAKMIDNNNIIIIHNNKNYYFKKIESKNIKNIKNIYDENVNFYINLKRCNFIYGDDQIFIAEFLKNYINSSYDHNQMKELRWDYSHIFEKKYIKLKDHYNYLTDSFVGHRINTKNIYEKLFENIKDKKYLEFKEK